MGIITQLNALICFPPSHFSLLKKYILSSCGPCLIVMHKNLNLFFFSLLYLFMKKILLPKKIGRHQPAKELVFRKKEMIGEGDWSIVGWYIY